MDNAFGDNLVSITDEDGNEYTLEELMVMDYNDQTYVLYLPAYMQEDDPDYGFIILKRDERDGEVELLTVDDDQELEDVYEMYMTHLAEDEEEAE